VREERTIGLGSGLAGVVLVIVIAWALAAVLMLTGTLTNARQINRRVKLVNAQVGPIDNNLASVKLAGRTGRIAKKIDLAAEPLSGELNQVITTAGSINTKVGSILSKAQSINGVVTAINTTANAINANANAINATAHSINATVHSINANALSINATAHSINSNVHSINSHVQAIGGSVASIGGNVASIRARVVAIQGVVGPARATDRSINANANRIDGNLGKILTTADAARHGVMGINQRADVVIRLVRALKGDFDIILAGVGTALNTPTILGHANSIDCSRLLNFLGPTTGCGKL